jgi:SAM-dependent methyltransferase
LIPSDRRFRCNVCGRASQRPPGGFDREAASCGSCGSNVRTRGLLHALSLELFDTAMALPDFPRVKSLRGLGLSDSNPYAALLAEKFDYRNTFFDREPRLDIMNPPADESGRYDFIIASEVFEHVPPPVERAFSNAFRMLKPTGVLLFTVPYSLEASAGDHFPELHEFGLGRLGERLVLINKTRAGEVQVFEDIVFHGGIGRTLEMREFDAEELRGLIADAGYPELRIYDEECASFGIVWSGTWSLPMAARKGSRSLNREAVGELVREWHTLRVKFDTEMDNLNRSYWFRLGRKFRIL